MNRLRMLPAGRALSWHWGLGPSPSSALRPAIPCSRSRLPGCGRREVLRLSGPCSLQVLVPRLRASHQPLHPQACKEKADAFLFLFSFTDRASFEDLPGQLARVAGEAPGVVRMVIGSKYPLGGP